MNWYSTVHPAVFLWYGGCFQGPHGYLSSQMLKSLLKVMQYLYRSYIQTPAAVSVSLEASGH